MRKRIIVLVSLYILQVHAFSQVKHIKGHVYDVEGVPIPYAHIYVGGSKAGTLSGADGEFQLKVNLNQNNVYLYVSHINFLKDSMQIQQLPNENIKFILQAVDALLSEVKVYPAENPAYPIVRKVLANRDRHNPDRLDSYTLEQYHRLSVTSYNFDTDSLNLDERNKNGFYKHAHIYITETQSEVFYSRKRGKNEHIIASRMSGVEQPPFVFTGTDFQPLHVYNDYLYFLDQAYLHPIGNGTFNRYEFELEDSLWVNNRKLYLISYSPKSGKSFAALKGYMYIVAEDYAIYSMYAEQAVVSGKISFNFKQDFEKIENHWFPYQSQTEYNFSQMLQKNTPMLMRSRFQFNNITIGKTENDNQTRALGYTSNDDIYRNEHTYWEKVRNIPLTQLEKNTFENFDSLSISNKKKLNALMNVSSHIMHNEIPFNNLIVHSDKLLKINLREGYRFGLGLGTSQKLSAHLGISAYGAYGTRDNAFKYGGSTFWNMHESSQTRLSIVYKNDVQEPASTQLRQAEGLLVNTDNAVRRYLISKMDRVEAWEVNLESQIRKGLKMWLGLHQSHIVPLYEYQYARNGELYNEFNLRELNYQIRYAPNEEYMKIGPYYLPKNNSFPRFQISLQYALDGPNLSNMDFVRLYFESFQRFRFKQFGTAYLSTKSGMVLGHAPYSRLLLSPAAQQESTFNVLVDNHFQTMGVYEFTHDAFAAVFFKHDFGRILSKAYKWTDPRFTVYQRAMIGQINPNSHQSLELKSTAKGYYESGISLEQLFRWDVGFYYLTLGTGAFYRYGPYQFADWEDNLALVLSFSISI